MVSAVGIDASKVFTFVLMLGISLAALAGGLYAPLSTIGVGMDIGILVESFCHRDHRGSGESYRHAPGGTDRRRNLCVRHPASARS